MGRCHEKLGNEDAQRAYRRVVQEYPDQTDMVAEARGRLTALQRLAARPASSGVVVREVPFEGRPSLDGRHVVYTDWTTSDIAIRDIRTDEVRRVTTTGTEVRPIQFGMDPAFSPDGKYVAYEWHHPDSKSYYDLRIVPADGSGPPWVLYIAVARYPNDDSRTDLLWVSVDDGSARVLDTYAPSGYMGLSHSPDDRYVVYAVHNKGESVHYDIHIAATDGSGSRPIVEHPADDRLLGWVPGTDWVLFLSNRSNVWGAWAVRVVDGRAVGQPRLVHPGLGQAHPGGFTEDGDFYHNLPVRWFTTYTASFDMATGEIDTARAQPLPGSTMTPEWSPDGARLAFREERSHFQGTEYKRPLRVLDVATGEVRELAAHLSTSRPRWSSDGQYVVVSAYDDNVSAPDYHGGIYRIDAETGDVELLVALPAEPAWWYGTTGILSADGGSLFYVRDGMEGLGGKEGQDGLILRRDLKSGIEVELYRDPNVASYPFSLSHDGRRLVFAVVDTTQDHAMFVEREGARLMLLELEAETVRELGRIGEAGMVESVTWTPDGRHLMYPQTTESGTTIWKLSIDGGEPEKVTETFRFREGAISRDGTRIAYTRGSINSKSMVLENLKAVLER
jgi:Tol biopolymer transport system component